MTDILHEEFVHFDYVIDSS